MYRQLSLTIVGTTPLVMHNGQSADSLNKYSKMLKEVAGKRKKDRSRPSGAGQGGGSRCPAGRVWRAGIGQNGVSAVTPAEGAG